MALFYLNVNINFSLNPIVKMERRDFLEKLGIGAAFVLTTSCLQSCKKDATTTPSGVDFTINLDDTANASLKTNGNYIISNGTVVAKTTTGEYVAATVTCSHEGNKAVQYDKANNRYLCTVHGAQFDLTGKGLNANASKGLTIYKTTLTGNSLRVFA
jgi:cytochrome b6-f complex iron-sulfur subunit